MEKLSKILLILLLAVFLATGSASATAFLQYSDGVTTIEIQDNVGLDMDSTLGVVSYSGSLGSWNFALTGTSKDVIGSATSPEMDVNSVVTGGTGPFVVSFSDTDFFPPDEGSGDFSLYVDGTAGGTVTWNADVLDYIVPFGTFGPGDYAKLATGSIFFGGDDDVPSYSITMVGEFTAGSPVPEPATILLFGSGLIGLAGFRRKIKK